MTGGGDFLGHPGPQDHLLGHWVTGPPSLMVTFVSSGAWNLWSQGDRSGLGAKGEPGRIWATIRRHWLGLTTITSWGGMHRRMENLGHLRELCGFADRAPCVSRNGACACARVQSSDEGPQGRGGALGASGHWSKMVRTGQW